MLGRNDEPVTERLCKGRTHLHKKDISLAGPKGKKRNGSENSLRRLRRCSSTVYSCKIGSGQSLGVVQHQLARSYSAGSKMADIGVASRK